MLQDTGRQGGSQQGQTGQGGSTGNTSEEMNR